MWPFDKFGKAEAKAQQILRNAAYDGTFRRMRIVAHSPADHASNVRLHAETNRTLLSTVLDGHAGECIHITGKMTALADPFHRRVCAEVARQGKTRFTVVYDGSDPDASDNDRAAASSAKRWTDIGWSDKLSALRLIGEEYVDVRAAPTKEAVQYTVFGSRFTQLQGEHREIDGAAKVAKLVWLIDSEEVNGFLTEKARTMISQSRDVHERGFRDFFVRANGVVAHDLLTTLSTGGPQTREALLTRRLLDFDPRAGEILNDLEALNLVSAGPESVIGITSEGSQFIAAVE